MTPERERVIREYQELYRKSAEIGWLPNVHQEWWEKANDLLIEIDKLRGEVKEFCKESARLKEILAVSEMFREAYRKGKLELYAMRGEIADAARSHLPCSEGLLERAAAKATGERMGWISVSDYHELCKEKEKLEEENLMLREALKDLEAK